MATVYYPAIVERGPEGFGVFFPDLPGCVSAGATIQEAAGNAEDALAGHLLVAAEYGDELAPPSAIDFFARDPEVDEVLRLIVRGEVPGKKVRLNVTLDEGLVAAIDRTEPNRSRFLEDAARAALAARRAAVA